MSVTANQPRKGRHKTSR